jgi:nuclear pore complex protein Nup210
VVSAVISEVGRHTAIIIAEDVSSGEVLRCDVIVDSIASLSIVTTTREIFIEEAPEVFEVRAYDDLGMLLLSFV